MGQRMSSLFDMQAAASTRRKATVAKALQATRVDSAIAINNVPLT